MADASSQRQARPERPLSPHLQVYRMPISMLMSIVHRMTGAALYLGTALLAWWLVAAATNADYFNYVSSWFGTLVGQVILFGYTWALLHHMLGGFRHFIWDTGRGFDLETVDRLSWATIGLSLIGTVAIWYCVASNAAGA